VTLVAITPRSFRETPGKHLDLLEQSGLQARFPTEERPLQEDEMVAFVRGCEGLVVGVDPVSERVLAAGPLRAVVKYGSGLDNVDLDAAARLDVEVAATPGANARSVGELALALLLALARHVVAHDRSIRTGSWARRTGIELAGRRLGIIGYGSVGHAVAELARSFGMEVVAYDPFEDERNVDVELVGLEELLGSCDAVSLHLPLTDATRNLIGRAELARMRPDAVLVNTARGGIVDEEALAEALTAGTIAAAAFDVFAEEPPSSSPLLELENFVASPHAGAVTVEAVERAGVAALSTLMRALGAAAEPRRGR
jgi:D-3-phosphoglycerate dehydrogenase